MLDFLKLFGIRKRRYGKMIEGFSARTIDPRTAPDSEHERDKLSERELMSIEENICPDCGGEIRWGPTGGASQNVKCFGACGARFNFCLLAPAITERLTERTYRYGLRLYPSNH